VLVVERGKGGIMRIATGTGLVTAIVVALVAAGPAAAQPCGDANRTGDVTVTDGVLVLRSAAELPGICPRERCDMNLDSRVSVTDGVLALRLAAGVQAEVQCSSAQADLFLGQLGKTIGLGQSATPAARARAAGSGSTIPCSGGGFVQDDGFTLTFVECAEGDFITDGTLDFTEIDGGVSVFYDTIDFVVSTGEVVTTFGGLDFIFDDPIRVDGFLDHSSSILGDYSEEFVGVLLDQDFIIFSGKVTSSIINGAGLFANLSSVTINIYSTTLSQIVVVYTSQEFDVFIVGNDLCEPCSGGCSNPSLACLSCVDDCTNSTARCSTDFSFLECSDGVFGPTGLCAPCTSNDQCDASEGLSCFPCDENCTGSVDRCGSSLAFVECEDGTF
jgi:hypothetical protein